MIIIGLDIGRERHQFHVVEPSKRTLDTGCVPNASWAYDAWADHMESAFGTEIQVAIESTNGLASPKTSTWLSVDGGSYRSNASTAR